MSTSPEDDVGLIAGDPELVASLMLKQDPKIAATLRSPSFEKHLIRHAKRGIDGAFEVLYWRHNKPLWNRIFRLVPNKQTAEDLHQETFIRAWSNLQKFDDDDLFGPWLYRIGANLAIDHLRRSKKLAFLSFPEFEPEDDERFSTSGHEKHACDLDYVEQLLSQISPRTRTCIVLQDIWGYSQREIATLLNVSISCVGAYIYRGREQLRQIHCSNQQGGKV